MDESVQALVQFTGIAGEANVANFETASLLTGLRLGLGDEVDCGDATSEVVLRKRVDRATPLLLERSATAAPIEQVTITLRKVGDRPTTFLRYELHNAVVLRQRVASEARLPQEELRLDYTRLDWTYTPVGPTGTTNTSMTGTHNKPLAGPTTSCPTEAPLPDLDAAVDMFVASPQLEGESRNARHSGEIDTTGFTTGIRATGAGCAATAGPAVDAFTFTHVVDKASPALFQRATGGQRLSTVRLDVDAAGGDQHRRLSYRLTDVEVIGVSTDGRHETVSLQPHGVYELSYDYRSADGTLLQTVVGSTQPAP